MNTLKESFYMIGRLNPDFPLPIIDPTDCLSKTPKVIKGLIVEFLQEVDSARFKGVSRSWQYFYQEKADECSVRVQSLLQHTPSLIFRKQLYYSHISRILYVSQKALVLLETDGVLCSLDRKNWRNIAPHGRFGDSESCIPVQTALQLGHVAFAQNRHVYSVRLEDNVIVDKSSLRLDEDAPMVPCMAVIQSNKNEKFYVYGHNIVYLDREGNLRLLEERGFGSKVTKSVLQDNWLSVIFCEDRLSKNAKIRVYNAQTKQLAFEENGKFYHTKNRLIVNNSKNIFVFDMDSPDSGWQQNPIWVGTIENGNGLEIFACNDQYLVLRTFSCSNQNETMRKARAGEAWDPSELKVFVKYMMLNLNDGSQESFTKQKSGKSDSESTFLAQNFLFLYLDGKLDVIDLRLKKLIATNLEIPGFCVILDVKILEKELLIYFTTNDHIHCMLQFTLEDKEIPLVIEKTGFKEKIEVADTPIVEDPPRELPSAPIAAAIPIVAAADGLLLPPPPLARDNNAPNFLSSLRSRLSSCFSILTNFCNRIIKIFWK